MNFEAIGIYHSALKAPYEAGRQASELVHTQGRVVLEKGRQFEQALEDLAGFERIWLIYQFHHNTTWKPKVLPPRGSSTRKGVFATRSPYRPNPLGLSCVRLLAIEGLELLVEGADLLDGSPILDLKPYLPYADAFPEAKTGWLENIEDQRYEVIWTEAAEQSLEFLKNQGLVALPDFIMQQLEYDPLESQKKRVRPEGDHFVLAYKTWRIHFTLINNSISVFKVTSGYQHQELVNGHDPYHDKELHRLFLKSFPRS